MTLLLKGIAVKEDTTATARLQLEEAIGKSQYVSFLLPFSHLLHYPQQTTN